MKRNKEGGFTLIEMLVVVVIIATLAAMIVPRFAGRTEEAKASAAAAAIEADLASGKFTARFLHENYGSPR